MVKPPKFDVITETINFKYLIIEMEKGFEETNCPESRKVSMAQVLVVRTPQTIKGLLTLRVLRLLELSLGPYWRQRIALDQ